MKLAAFFLQDIKIKGLNHRGTEEADLRESAFSAVEILDDPRGRWAPGVCSLPPVNDIFARYTFSGYSRSEFLMFTDFTATDRWTQKQVHCLYQALIVAIATRHADAVDIKFLVDGRPVWVALPHPAWVEYKNRTGKLITDSLAKEIAGHFLKTALESGEGLGREMYSLTIDQTLRHLEGVVSEVEPSVAATR